MLKKSELLVWIIPLVVAVLIIGIASFVTGCAAVAPACAVVKIADDVCTVVEYVGEDGQTHQVPVSSSDLQGLARASAMRLRDAGYDASPVP